MNLLTDNWIPVRPQESGSPRQISLKTLLCEKQAWELTLPRDDLELAALQLLISLVQVILPPEGKKQWLVRLKNPVSEKEYTQSIQPYLEWFQLDHPEYPFMQTRGVEAEKDTLLDKILPGLRSSENGVFVNEQGLAKGLCSSCASIALFNQANNAPSFCGGVKAGLRSANPVTTFIQGENLTQAIWLNVITLRNLKNWFIEIKDEKLNWVEPIKFIGMVGKKKNIKGGEKVHCSSIGLSRGLFWQPAHIELQKLNNSIVHNCSCCGMEESKYSSLKFEKFSYEYSGFWHHPHSPSRLTVKKGEKQQKFVSFTSPMPAWTQLSRYVVKHELDENNKEGQEPALVIQQATKYAGGKYNRLELLVGGYRNNKASILERRHEVLMLNQGWGSHPEIIHELVKHGMAYQSALYHAVLFFSEKKKESEQKKDRRKLKKVGLSYKESKKTKYALVERATTLFYRISENVILDVLATVDFNNPFPAFLMMDNKLTDICRNIFEEITSIYQQDLELFYTLAIARQRILNTRLKKIRYQVSKEEAA